MSTIALIGRPGGGKTTLAASMASLGYIPHFIDVDCKIKTLNNLQPLIQEGKITYAECPEPLTDRSLKSTALALPKDRHPKTMPKGYLWIVEQIDKLEDDPPANADRIVPILDGMTSTAEHMKRLIRYHLKTYKLGFDGWDLVLDNWMELFDVFFHRLPRIYPHTIVIAHTKDDKDEIVQTIETYLMVDGSFKDKAAAFLEEIYFCYAKAQGMKKTFWVQTAPVDRLKIARTGRNLEVHEDVTIIDNEGGFELIDYGPYKEKEIKNGISSKSKSSKQSKAKRHS